MNTQVFDKDKEGYSRVFGVKVEAMSAVFVVIIGMVAYGGPIVAGTIYLQNIYNGLEQVRQTVTRLQSGPEAISEIKIRIARVEDMQNKIVSGDTVPQGIVREQIHTITENFKACRERADAFDTRINELRRDADRLLERIHVVPNR